MTMAAGLLIATQVALVVEGVVIMVGMWWVVKVFAVHGHNTYSTTTHTHPDYALRRQSRQTKFERAPGKDISYRSLSAIDDARPTVGD